MTRKEAFIALNMVPALGYKKVTDMLKVFREPQDIFKASSEELKRFPGIGREISRGIKEWKEDQLKEDLRLIKKFNARVITFEEKDYPPNLKILYDPPLVLYIRGDIKEDDRLAIGIVGARYGSLYGLTMAEKLGRELSAREFTIVSGLARGIDSASHRGTLKAGGRTIGVLGSGVDVIYPPENKALAEKIIENGAIISEFPMGTIPDRANFPKRNRIISGLSLGVVVVEAAKRSGSLITATFALEQGRLVFAIPGRADSIKSEGAHNLIKDGAILVNNVEDIIKEIEPMLGGFKLEKKVSAPKRPNLPQDEARLFSLVTNEGVHIDELIQKSNLPAGTVNAFLLKLQLKSLIKERPGKIYIPV